jgi:hypothetical protein
MRCECKGRTMSAEGLNTVVTRRHARCGRRTAGGISQRRRTERDESVRKLRPGERFPEVRVNIARPEPIFALATRLARNPDAAKTGEGSLPKSVIRNVSRNPDRLFSDRSDYADADMQLVRGRKSDHVSQALAESGAGMRLARSLPRSEGIRGGRGRTMNSGRFTLGLLTRNHISPKRQF